MAGGSLKLKGTPAGPSYVLCLLCALSLSLTRLLPPALRNSNKKKKKSSTTKRLREEEGAASGSASGGEREGSAAKEERDRDESPSTSTAASLSGKTEAQRKFEEVQKKRVSVLLLVRALRSANLTLLQLLEKAAKLANKSHKERVAEFNEKLEAMSEHHDIPRESLDPARSARDRC